MGKRIIQQARGKGSLTYRARPKAFKYRVGYPSGTGTAKVIDIINSPAHYAPLAKILFQEKIFYNPANQGLIVGQNIELGKAGNGNIVALKDIPIGEKIFNIECHVNDGGKLIRTSGSSAIVNDKKLNKVFVLLPSKKIITLDENCRAVMGVIAGAGRKDKPIIKAGKQWHIKKAKNELWPRTSAVKMNVIDHPFGSGRGKRIKQKTAKRNSPPGAKVGHLNPRRTGGKR
jgi:large subunit ribosomal protein L2